MTFDIKALLKKELEQNLYGKNPIPNMLDWKDGEKKPSFLEHLCL